MNQLPIRNVRFNERPLSGGIPDRQLPTVAAGFQPTTPASHQIRNFKALFLLIVIFFISRIFWYYSGIRFHTVPLLWFHQYIDPYLMQNHLLQSTLYLHTQPPLFNLLIGAVIKFAPAHAAKIFPVVFLAMGIVLCLGIYKVLVNFNVSRKMTLILTSLFILSPASILYENWLFYTYPIAVLLVVSVVSLQVFVKQRSFLAGFIFFCSLSACVLIRTAFHLIWLLAILFVLVRVFRSDAKLILKCAAIPLLSACALYLWTFYLFGSMPSSTWMGMSFYKVAAYGITNSERSALIAEGKLSEASRVPPYSWLSSYSPHINKAPVTEIPVLDQKVRSTGFNNYHNFAYHSIAKMYLKDALFLVFSRPDSYVQGLKTAFYIYHQSSSTVHFLEPNQSMVKNLNFFFDRVLFGKIHSQNDTFWFLFAAILILPIYGLIKGYRFIKQKELNFALPLLFISLNIIYFTIVTCAFEVGENQRYRFEIDTFYLFLFGVLIQDIQLTIRRRKQMRI